MSRSKKTDFSILLKEDFNTVAARLAIEVRDLAEKKNRSNDEQAALLHSTTLFLEAYEKADKQNEALSLLFDAAGRGDTSTLKDAFNQGVGVNILNRGGNTLLSYAAAGGQIHAVEFLIDQKADLDLKQGSGFSPLEYATIKDNADIFNALARAGATVDKNTLLPLARKNEAAMVLKILQG